jgi:hypothetical protein
MPVFLIDALPMNSGTKKVDASLSSMKLHNFGFKLPNCINYIHFILGMKRRMQAASFGLL